MAMCVDSIRKFIKGMGNWSNGLRATVGKTVADLRKEVCSL
jgi:hypothetical protein